MEYIESKYFSYADPDDPIVRKILIRSIEYCAGQPAIYNLYRKYQENPSNWKSFWDGCVDLLNLDIDIAKESINNIPESGPTIIVANHPFGVLDGTVLSWLVSQRRDDFKLLVHSLLLRAPETKKYLKSVIIKLTSSEFILIEFFLTIPPTLILFLSNSDNDLISVGD